MSQGEYWGAVYFCFLSFFFGCFFGSEIRLSQHYRYKMDAEATMKRYRKEIMQCHGIKEKHENSMRVK